MFASTGIGWSFASRDPRARSRAISVRLRSSAPVTGDAFVDLEDLTRSPRMRAPSEPLEDRSGVGRAQRERARCACRRRDRSIGTARRPRPCASASASASVTTSTRYGVGIVPALGEELVGFLRPPRARLVPMHRRRMLEDGRRRCATLPRSRPLARRVSDRLRARRRAAARTPSPPELLGARRTRSRARRARSTSSSPACLICTARRQALVRLQPEARSGSGAAPAASGSRNSGRGGRWNSTTTCVDVVAMRFPARR